MPRLNPPRDFFSWEIKFVQVLGLYPPRNRIWGAVYYFFSIPHLVLMLASIILEVLNIILNEDVFVRKMLNLGMLCLHLVAALRLIGWFMTKGRFEKVLEIIRRPTFNFRIFRYTGSRLRSGRIIGGKRGTTQCVRCPIGKFQIRKLRQTERLCTVWFVTVFGYVCGNFLISYTGNYLNDTYAKHNPALNRTSVYKDFVYPTWYPFDVSVSDGHYLLAFLYQPYALFTLMQSFCCIDCLILSAVVHLQGQVKVIAFALQEVDKDIDEAASRSEVIAIKEMRVVKCIQELNVIFGAADDLENMYNEQLLAQCILAAFILCTLLYVSANLTAPVEILYISSEFAVVLLEPFLQCWVCQDFTLEFLNILRGVQELDWINYPPKLRRVLVFTMARLQKPPAFTLGKYTTVDIPFYLALLKMTYSFYTLITHSTSSNNS